LVVVTPNAGVLILEESVAVEALVMAVLEFGAVTLEAVTALIGNIEKIPTIFYWHTYIVTSC
jgi:hypothetical protein